MNLVEGATLVQKILTSDGQLFDDLHHANQHQRALNLRDRLARNYCDQMELCPIDYLSLGAQSRQTIDFIVKYAESIRTILNEQAG